MARKLTFAVIFALAMCVLMVPAASTTYANESPSTEYYNVQYGFSYEETVMPTNQIVRKYEKPETSLFSRSTTTNSTEKTKAILASLGMDEEAIDNLSSGQISMYANSESIESTVSYIRTTSEGVSTYITEEEALSGARSYDPPAYEDFGDGGGGIPSYEEAVKEDSYMKLSVYVSYKGNGFYNLSALSKWLKSPVQRINDSIGVCMTDCNIQFGTVQGWCSRMIHTESPFADPVVNEQKEYFTEGDFSDASHYDWHGVAATINLLNYDYSDPNTWIDRYYTDHMAYIQFDVEMKNLSDKQSFNVAATHSHLTYDYVFVPEIGIDLIDGQLAASIGFQRQTSVENRVAYFPQSLHYYPED